MIRLKLKYNVLGGDTDSAFTQLIDNNKKPRDLLTDDEIKEFLSYFNTWCAPEDRNDFDETEQILIGMSYHLTGQLNEYYKKYEKQFNIKDNYLQIKPEDISSVFFTVRKKGSSEAAKKRYAKKKIVEFEQDKPIKVNKINIKGFKKSDLSEIGNQIVENIMDLVCVDKTNEEIKIEISDYLREEIQKIKTMQYDFTQICRRVGMSKHIVEYANQEHVRAARWTNEHAHLWNGTANLGKGSIIKYIFIKPQRMFRQFSRTDVIALDDNNYLPEKFNSIIDFSKLINKTVLQPLSEVLEGLDIGIQYIKSGKREKRMF